MNTASRRRSRALAFWLGWALASMVLWLLLTSTIDPAEAIVGAGASAIAATIAEIVRVKEPFVFRPRARWFRRAWRIPVQIALDTTTVTGVLLLYLVGRRQVRGSWWAIPFRHGGAGDATDAARRALATIGTGLSPNSYVVGVHESQDFLFVHQLQANPRPVTDLVGEP
jgi:multisubunit Na+/H+ antiporter MnhE subunit